MWAVPRFLGGHSTHSAPERPPLPRCRGLDWCSRSDWAICSDSPIPLIHWNKGPAWPRNIRHFRCWWKPWRGMWHISEEWRIHLDLGRRSSMRLQMRPHNPHSRDPRPCLKKKKLFNQAIDQSTKQSIKRPINRSTGWVKTSPNRQFF